MFDNYKLYVLVDKNQPGEIRYVGQTKNDIQVRLSQHKRCKLNKYKSNWINKIGKDNLIIHVVSDNISLSDINNMERILINECRIIGYRLTNITDGGEGWKGMKFSESHKKNISENHHNVSGVNNPMFGKKHKQVSVDKIKNAIKKWHNEIGYSEDRIYEMKERFTGSKNHKAILDDEKVIEIRRLSSEGVNNSILSKKFGVDVPAIWKIVNNYTWKHLN